MRNLGFHLSIQMPLLVCTKLPLFFIKNAVTIPMPRTDKIANAANTISMSWCLLLVLPTCSKNLKTHIQVY